MIVQRNRATRIAPHERWSVDQFVNAQIGSTANDVQKSTCPFFDFRRGSFDSHRAAESKRVGVGGGVVRLVHRIQNHDFLTKIFQLGVEYIKRAEAE